MTDQITGSLSAIKINANQVKESEDESDHEGLVRHHATCDNCEKPIYGVRHKCLDCPNWDYCSKCVDIAEHIHHRDRFKAIYGSQPAPGTYGSLPTDEGTHWTRLLLLRQGEPSDTVECLLRPYDLNTLQYIDKSEKLLPYVALSYVWGSREDMREIIVNGEPVKVTKNLHEALVAVRIPSTSQSLWVDAICINQEDTEERSSQVAKMASVYRQAARVFIWLGHDDPEYVEPAFTYLCQRANKKYLFGWTRTPFKIRLASYVTRRHEVPASELQLEDVRPTPAQYEAFCAFLRQPWFYRLWVVQEASVCKKATFFWHESYIDLAFVMVALAEWREDSELLEPPRGLDNIVTIRSNRQFEYKGASKPFAKMLYDVREFSCYDPKDRVYGLLGMKAYGTDPENGDLFIKPDYNVHAHDLYTQVAKKMIIERNEPYLISCVYHGDEITDGLPSWVPDWSKPAPALDSFRIGGEIYGNTGPVLDTYGVDVSLITRTVRGSDTDKEESQEYLRIAGSHIAGVEKVTPILRAEYITSCFSGEDEETQNLKDMLKDLCDKLDDEDVLTAMLRHRVYPQKLLDSWPEPFFGYKDLYTFLTTPDIPESELDEEQALVLGKENKEQKEYYSPIPKYGGMSALDVVLRNSPEYKQKKKDERKALPVIHVSHATLISRFRASLAALVDGRRLFAFSAVEHYAPPLPPPPLSPRSSPSSSSPTRSNRYGPIYRFGLKWRIASAPAIIQKSDMVVMLFNCFEFCILRDTPNQGFNRVKRIRGKDEAAEIKGVRLLGTCDISGYNYEWQVARHRVAERPIDYFEIF